jgi:hypothetical protein
LPHSINGVPSIAIPSTSIKGIQSKSTTVVKAKAVNRRKAKRQPPQAVVTLTASSTKSKSLSKDRKPPAPCEGLLVVVLRLEALGRGDHAKGVLLDSLEALIVV